MENRLKLEKKLKSGKGNLLMVVVLSAINVGLTLADSTLSFMFSATFPTLAVEFGKLFSETYRSDTIMALGVILAFVAIGCYLICYLMSKTKKTFLVVALVLFSIDTLILGYFLTLGFDLSTGLIIEIGFHAWVLYSLAAAIKAWSDLDKLPPDNAMGAYSHAGQDGIYRP